MIKDDLRRQLKRGQIVGNRFVEFAKDPHWNFGKKFGLSSQGPTSVKHNRPCLVREVHYDHFGAHTCRNNDEQGLQAG